MPSRLPVFFFPICSSRHARPARVSPIVASSIMPDLLGHLLSPRHTPGSFSLISVAGAHLRDTPETGEVPSRPLQRWLSVSGVSPNRTPASQNGKNASGVRPTFLCDAHLGRFPAISPQVRTCATHLRRGKCLPGPYSDG